jgi:hypothetical protein
MVVILVQVGMQVSSYGMCLFTIVIIVIIITMTIILLSNHQDQTVHIDMGMIGKQGKTHGYTMKKTIAITWNLSNVDWFLQILKFSTNYMSSSSMLLSSMLYVLIFVTLSPTPGIIASMFLLCSRVGVNFRSFNLNFSFSFIFPFSVYSSIYRGKKSMLINVGRRIPWWQRRG